jgi:V8-like Glu-specific endopeptidase
VEQRSLASDYGAVFLNEPIGNALGQFGYAAVPNSTFGRVAVNIAGYPDDKEPPGSLWWHERRVERATSNALLYTIDTCGGQSGAPVWFVDGVKRTVVGIHGNGLDRANMAARITADVFANIQRWNQEAERAI